MIHGFFGMVGVVDAGGDAMAEANAALRNAFALAAAPSAAGD
jgi:hypothetical protein